MRRLLILFLLAPSISFADEVSLVKHVKRPVQEDSQVKAMPPKKEKSGKEDKEFQEMKEFIVQETGRLNAIRILNLDLERADLEFKKREAEVKLAQLNASSSELGMGTAVHIDKKAHIKLTGIFISKDIKEASFDIDGRFISLRVGAELPKGIKLMKIDADAVTLSFADGKEEILNLES